MAAAITAPWNYTLIRSLDAIPNWLLSCQSCTFEIYSVDSQSGQVLHWLRRRYLCDQSVLVLPHVRAKRCRHCECHSRGLGQFGRWRDANFHDERALQPNGWLWHGAKRGLASVHDRAGHHVRDLCRQHEAPV